MKGMEGMKRDGGMPEGHVKSDATGTGVGPARDAGFTRHAPWRILAYGILTFLAVFAVFLGAEDLTTGLLGKWSFDVGGADGTAMSNHGTLVGGATVGPGTNRNAVFVSNNRYVDMGGRSSLNVADQMTIAAWIYAAGGFSSGGRQTIASRFNNSAGWMFDLIDATGSPRLSTTAGTASAGFTMPSNAWMHLAGTYDGTNISVYTNGALAATALGSGPIANSGNFQVGSRQDYGNYFSGRIDEVYFFGRALSTAEVLALKEYSAHPIVYTNIRLFGKITTAQGTPVAGVLAWVQNPSGTTAGAYSREDGTFSLEVGQRTNVSISFTPPRGVRLSCTLTHFTTEPTNFSMDFSAPMESVVTATFKAPGFYSPVQGDLTLEIRKTAGSWDRVVVTATSVNGTARYRLGDETLPGTVALMTIPAQAMRRLLHTGTWILEMKIIPDGKNEMDPGNVVVRRILVFGR